MSLVADHSPAPAALTGGRPDHRPGAMPTLFISHGAPTLALDEGPTQRFLATLEARLGRPRAVLMVSAHWEAEDICVMGTAAPPTIHDFFGFPAPLYELRYPAQGSAALAQTIAGLLSASGYPVTVDATRGYDHGAWVPLRLLYPDADVPVLQLSINPSRPPAWHWRLGRALAALRADGVLIVGSGSMTHNLQDFRRLRHAVDCPPEPYAADFTDWFAGRVAARDLEALLAYRELAPSAVRAHPTDEHLLPFYVALGAAGVAWTAERLHHGFMHGAIAMDSYLFQSASAPDGGAVDDFNEATSGENHAI